MKKTPKGLVRAMSNRPSTSPAPLMPSISANRTGKTFSSDQLARALRYMDRLADHFGGNRSAASREVGLTQGAGNKLFTERSLGFDTLVKIVEHSGVPIEWFWYGGPEALETVLFARRPRWEPATIVAVIHLAQRRRDTEGWADGDWRAFLDQTERTLELMLRAPPEKKR